MKSQMNRTVLPKRLLFSIKNFVFFNLILIGAMSCSTKKIIVPPVTETSTNSYQEGKFVWHDLLTDKVPEVKKFYGELFGWDSKAKMIPKQNIL